ncbi:Esterase [Vibrio crassostreae]|nr:Esterase [Vibrio crassostreae]
MKRLILNITLLVFMALASMSAIAHDSMVKYGIAISHDGEQIAYGKSGSGETALIFIHGWSLDSRLWQNQVSEFSKQYQVITMDLAGHGNSSFNRHKTSATSSLLK